MLFSPLGHRNIIAALPFAKEQEREKKAHLERLKEIPVQSDPVPENRLSYKKAAVALTTTALGGVGLWYSGKALYNLLPFRREEPNASLSPSSQPGWTKLIQAIPGTQALPWLYTLYQSDQGIDLGGRTAFNAYQEKKRGRLDLNKVYKALHQEGIRGDGFKVAVLDSFPNLEKSRKAKSDFMKAQSLLEGPHGAAVSEVIHKAVPKAEIIRFPALNRTAYSDVWDEMRGLIDASREDPEKLTRQAVRDCLKPLVDNLSDNLRSAVDQGVAVINVSLGPENLIPTLIGHAQAESRARFRKQGMRMALLGEPDFKAFERGKQRYQRLGELLSCLGPLNDKNRPIQPELISLYQPWYDALSYAASKNVLVVVSAGNKGKMCLEAKPHGLNHINPLGLKQGNANVMWAASTNEQGELSELSSEYNNKITPDIAANGSGQLNTKGPVLLPSVSWLRVNPLFSVPIAEIYRNPPGTSFAAPDITALYVMMQSARKKDGKPPLSLAEFQQVLRLAAKPVIPIQSQQRDAEWKANTLTQLEADELEKREQAYSDKKAASTETAESMASERQDLDFHQKDLKAFKEQLQKQITQEMLHRRVGSNGTIAGRRLHAVALGRAYESEVQRSQHLQDVSGVD